MQAKTVIVAEVEAPALAHLERQGQNAQRGVDRIRKIMHTLQRGEARPSHDGVPSRERGRHCTKFDRYLDQPEQSARELRQRYRAGLRVGTSVTEGPQLPGHRRMASLNRCDRREEVPIFGLGSLCGLQRRARFGVGHLFEPVSSPGPQWAKAA